MNSTEPDLLLSRLLDADVLRDRIVSIVWIGSRSRPMDVHVHSDLDLQIVLDHPDDHATIELARVLVDYPSADLSIMYRSDITDPAGRLDFQDGTKGPFFIRVLADGVVLHGEDVYGSIAASLDLETVRPSLMFTIREYVCRLRVMAVRGGEPTHTFKKYCTKLLKDVLVHAALLPLTDMAGTSNAEVVKLFDAAYRPGPAEQDLLIRLLDPDDPFGPRERTLALGLCERVVGDLRRSRS